VGSMPPVFDDVAQRVGDGRRGSNVNNDPGGELSLSGILLGMVQAQLW